MGTPHAEYIDVTSIVCRQICVKKHGDSCCSVIYERAGSRCLITPLDHHSEDTFLAPKPNVFYFKRNKCSGQPEVV